MCCIAQGHECCAMLLSLSVSFVCLLLHYLFTTLTSSLPTLRRTGCLTYIKSLISRSTAILSHLTSSRPPIGHRVARTQACSAGCCHCLLTAIISKQPKQRPDALLKHTHARRMHAILHVGGKRFYSLPIPKPANTVLPGLHFYISTSYISTSMCTPVCSLVAPFHFLTGEN